MNRPQLIKLLAFATLLVLIASCCVMQIRAVNEARSQICRNNLKEIWLALNNYRLVHGSFPPAYLCDDSGKPVNSWRAEVIPFSWYTFRDRYNYAEPWNGPHNSSLELEKADAGDYSNFRCPSVYNEPPATTDYVAVVGPNTMWPGREPATPAADGSDKDKILVIEVVDSDILWMEPRDPTLDQALDSIQAKSSTRLGSHHGDGIHYVTVGGEVRMLAPNIDRESLRALFIRQPVKD